MKGSTAIFTTGVLVVTEKQSLPDIALGVSRERILSRVKLRALVDALNANTNMVAGKVVTAYVNDDYLEFSYSSGQVLDELDSRSIENKAGIRDLDLWKKLVTNIKNTDCRFRFATGAMLLGMCNEAAADYMRNVGVDML